MIDHGFDTVCHSTNGLHQHSIRMMSFDPNADSTLPRPLCSHNRTCKATPFAFRYFQTYAAQSTFRSVALSDQSTAFTSPRFLNINVRKWKLYMIWLSFSSSISLCSCSFIVIPLSCGSCLYFIPLHKYSLLTKLPIFYHCIST